MNAVYDPTRTALLVVDPYNDFLSEGGKLWPRLKEVAESRQLIPHLRETLAAARACEVRIRIHACSGV